MPRLRARAPLTGASAAADSPSPSPPLARPPRRAAARRSEELTSITVEATADRPARDKEYDRPTVTLKMPGSKLRDATARRVADSRDAYGSAASQRAPRSTRAKRAVVIESESDDEEGDDDADGDVEMDEDDEDAEGEDDEMEGLEGEDDADGDDDAEGEEDADGEDDEDVAMVAPTPPRPRAGKPTVTVTPASDRRAPSLPSVEAKEMQLASAGATTDDEELSELGPSEGLGSDDAEGEDDDDDDELGDDEELDADADADGETDEEGVARSPNSRESTPDVSKMTKRQRGRVETVMGNDFLQLPMEPQIKKHLTAEEHAMRRAEMARRRKNLSEKRNEEEKMDTINRLLKKQAPKRRGKISAAELAAGAGAADTPDPAASADGDESGIGFVPADPVFARWINRPSGSVLALPQEWKDIGGVTAWAGREGWREVIPVEEVEG